MWAFHDGCFFTVPYPENIVSWDFETETRLDRSVFSDFNVSLCNTNRRPDAKGCGFANNLLLMLLKALWNYSLVDPFPKIKNPANL